MPLAIIRRFVFAGVVLVQLVATPLTGQTPQRDSALLNLRVAARNAVTAFDQALTRRRASSARHAQDVASGATYLYQRIRPSPEGRFLRIALALDTLAGYIAPKVIQELQRDGLTDATGAEARIVLARLVAYLDSADAKSPDVPEEPTNPGLGPDLARRSGLLISLDSGFFREPSETTVAVRIFQVYPRWQEISLRATPSAEPYTSYYRVRAVQAELACNYRRWRPSEIWYYEDIGPGRSLGAGRELRSEPPPWQDFTGDSLLAPALPAACRWVARTHPNAGRGAEWLTTAQRRRITAAGYNPLDVAALGGTVARGFTFHPAGLFSDDYPTDTLGARLGSWISRQTTLGTGAVCRAASRRIVRCTYLLNGFLTKSLFDAIGTDLLDGSLLVVALLFTDSVMTHVAATYPRGLLLEDGAGDLDDRTQELLGLLYGEPRSSTDLTQRVLRWSTRSSTVVRETSTTSSRHPLVRWSWTARSSATVSPPPPNR